VRKLFGVPEDLRVEHIQIVMKGVVVDTFAIAG
jgi:hypothetical protein